MQVFDCAAITPISLMEAGLWYASVLGRIANTGHMRPIATDVAVAWSVCWTNRCAVQKRRNRSRQDRHLQTCRGYGYPWIISVDKKVAHTRLPSVGFRGWSRFLAVSLQVTWVINPAVGCQYFPPGPQLPPQPLTGLLPILLLGERRHDGCEQFA